MLQDCLCVLPLPFLEEAHADDVDEDEDDDVTYHGPLNYGKTTRDDLVQSRFT
jgi:hypothetical protein